MPKKTTEPKKKFNRNDRADHTPGARQAYEQARKRILLRATICAICGQPLDKSLKYPDPMSPTVDHIIPLAKGGHPYAMENLQAAHRKCNRLKSDHLLSLKFEDDSKPKAYNNRDLPQSADWRYF